MAKWYRFWARDEEAGRKQSVDNQLLDVDFFCQLSYMAAIATSGISRSGLFDYASRLPYISSAYFKRVSFVAKAFNHDYAEACRIVGQATKEPQVKSFLLRFSGALSSGEDIVSFLERESEVSSETYGNQYERRLETLKKWTDAYVALIMSTAIVTVLAVVSMIIGNITPVFIVGLATLTITVTISGVWLIYRTAPRETKNHKLSIRSREQNIARHLSRLLLPAGVAVVALLLATGQDLGYAMLAAAGFLLPIGIVAKIDDTKVDKRDSDIAGLLRSLGGVSQAIGSTVNEAMARLDFHSLGSLREDVNLLYTRLLAGINQRLCWEQFVGETGSEQVARAVRIFLDGISLGGDPERVGYDASGFAIKISLLRAKRRLIESGMLWLTNVMHLVLASLVVFVYQILITFTTMISEVMPDESGQATLAMTGLPSFGVFGGGGENLGLLHFMVIAIVVVLSFANAMAIFATSGGHYFKLAFYLAITLAMSGVALIAVPQFVQLLFAGFA